MADGVRSARAFVVDALTSSPSIQFANVTAPATASVTSPRVRAFRRVAGGGE